MNADVLLAYYERIAEAPDAIAQLRRFVLDLAVRGKLVPQDSSEEPASALAGRVAQEWARLLKAGAVREPTNAVQVPRANLPIDPPSRWSWARLIEIAKLSYGFAFASARFNSERRGMPLIRIRDIANTDTEAYYDGDFDPAYVVKAGDYLVGMDGDFNLRRWQGLDALLNQRVMRINGWRCGIDPEFVRLPLQFVLDHLHGQTSQTTVKHLSAKQVNGIEIPLPPLHEQHRIVAKVDELMALCDRLEAAQTAREARRDRLAAASLARLNTPDPETFPSDARFALAALPALTTRPDQIKQLRQTILNLAVRGKLVPQHPNDEPASELLKRLRRQRAAITASAKLRTKRPISLSPNASMRWLPPGWSMEALGNLVDPLATISYGVLVPGPDVDDGVPFVRAQDLALSNHPPRPQKTIAPEIEAAYARTRIRGGEILLCVVGSIGKLGIAPPSWAGANIARAVARIAPMSDIETAYALLVLRSGQGQGFFADATRTLAQPTLNVTLIEALPVPVPPLAEQRRIVVKVNELMALCDALEASLAAATDTRSRLLDVALRAALETDTSRPTAAAA